MAGYSPSYSIRLRFADIFPKGRVLLCSGRYILIVLIVAPHPNRPLFDSNRCFCGFLELTP